MGKKGKNRAKVPAKSKCRDCGREAVVPRYEFFKAGMPRCTACGGALEYQGSWVKTRSRSD